MDSMLMISRSFVGPQVEPYPEDVKQFALYRLVQVFRDADLAGSEGVSRGVDRLRSVLESTNSVLVLDVPFIFNGEVKSESRGGEFTFLVLPGGDVLDRISSVRKYISQGLGARVSGCDVSILVSCGDLTNEL